MRTAASEDRRFPEDPIAAFQTQLWEVLAKQVALYTMGESTSLPEYDAHRLLASTCYVLGVDPHDLDESTACALVARGVADAYASGLKRVEDATRRVGELWNEVCLAVPLLESVALRDTLESLRDFPARYEPRFFAHEIPADIDYPLAQPVSETTLGVDYVEAYLEQLLAECRFLGRFDLARCRAVLRSIHPDYGELILNLFEPVATAAVGCALVGEPVRALRMDEAACARAAGVVADASAPQMRELLAQAAERACDEMGVDVVTTRESVRQVAVDLEPRMRAAARRGSLGGMFASSS